MKASELRFGNTVACLHGPVEIEYLTEHGAHFTDGCGGNFASLSGIPLTEEWLLKFGWEKFPFNCYRKVTETGDVFELMISMVQPGAHAMGIVVGDIVQYFAWKISTVHRLQNLYFALTGEELKLLKENEAKENKI